MHSLRAKRSSSTPEPQCSLCARANPECAAPLQGPSTCPRCPGPPPTHFAAIAHAEEVIAKHLHGAGPGGVDESPSEDVRQRRRPSRTHVSGGAAARVHGSRRVHRAGGRRAVPVAAERELLGRLAPASLGNRLPPAGRAQGLAPCLLGANRIFLLPVGSTPMGCGFPLHPCVGFGYVNSLSYRN